jgi:formylglycine-generating enzyme required for sulfatase activity
MNAPVLPFTGRRTFPDPFPPSCASAWGDDRYGLWCEIEVGGVVQRLRWIEPGEFWMGSGQNDPGSYDDERPRHLVTLTDGFWLADTVCTQELWQTVVGSNPSHFTGDLQLPVEEVSWDAVTQVFLSVLSRQLNGAELILPTEAQWEYACRAGTESAYHFGKQVQSDQVNYDGKHPLLGWPKGEYRRCTIEVKALPANAWGLYQMHGNVLEWCADARRPYTTEPVKDPDGGQVGGYRVLRGGAWDDEARRVRSACREVKRRELGAVYFSFRFALRSIEPGAGGGNQANAEAGGDR